MGYYNMSDEEQEALARKGVDYDLVAAFEYNDHDWPLDEIEQVLAVWEGENDGDNWRWVVKRSNGEFWFIDGGCDYTGWDCQSWLSMVQMGSLDDLVQFEDNETVVANLADQLEQGKHVTWTEQKREELGLDEVPRIDIPKMQQEYPNLADPNYLKFWQNKKD